MQKKIANSTMQTNVLHKVRELYVVLFFGGPTV